MELITKSIVFVLTGVAIIVFFGMLLSLPVMYLWNIALVPAIPGIKAIGWLQAWGIMILCGLLFKTYNSSNKE